MSKPIEQALIRVCRKILPSIVRLLLPGGINCREFIEMAKRAYVDVVTEEYGLEGRPANISKTAILTGLSRPEVTRLRKACENPNGYESPEERRYNLTELLTEWHNQSEWCEPDGEPSELPLEGSSKSFEALVQKHFSNMPITAVLRELKEVGAVETDENDNVKVLRTFYRPPPLTGEHADLVGALIADFVTTVHSNLQSTSDTGRLVEYRVAQMDVPERHLPIFTLMLDKESQRFVERMDKWLHDKKSYETANGDALVRMGAGVYQIGKE